MKNQQFFNFFLEKEIRCFEDEIQVYVKEVTKKNQASSLEPQSLKKTIELLKNQQFFYFFLEKDIRCSEEEIQVYVKEVTKEATPKALSLKPQSTIQSSLL